MTSAGRHSRLPRKSESKTARGLAGNKKAIAHGMLPVSHDDIRFVLHKILSSPEFSSVVQLRAFLNYIVIKAIEDRTEEIKGYTIAVEAFGRDSSFNPVTDPIVRVEAARLRRRLEKYYAHSGKDDPIIIEIPKGGYAPVFRLRKKVSNNAPGGKKQKSASARNNNNDEQDAGVVSESASASFGASTNNSAMTDDTLLVHQPTNSLADELRHMPPQIPFARTDGAATSSLLNALARGMWLPIATITVILSFLAGYLTGSLL